MNRSYQSIRFAAFLIPRLGTRRSMLSVKCLTGKSDFHQFDRRGVHLLKMLLSFSLLWSNQSKSEEPKEDKAKIELLKIADKQFDDGNFEQCYVTLYNYEGPADVEIKWRICRALYNMAKEKNTSEEQKKNSILMAFNLISEALKLHDDHYAVHKWYALLLDAKSSEEGMKKRIEELENVKRHMDKAAALNPKDPTTLHMLGEWCYQIADMPWHYRAVAKSFFASPPHSTYEDALSYYLAAEDAQPRFYSLNLLMIGKTYIKLDKPDLAKFYLQLAAAYPATSNDDHKANKEASQLLSKLK